MHRPTRTAHDIRHSGHRLAEGDPVRITEPRTNGLWEIVDTATGRQLAASPSRCLGLPFLADPGQPEDSTRELLATNDGRDCPGPNAHWVHMRLTEDKRYAVYAAAPVAATALVPLDTNRDQLMIGVPALVLLIGTIAWLSVRGALRPVDVIRAEVAEISETDLHRRVPVPATADELAALAETMNDMLARLDDAAERQRRFVADSSHELRSPLASLRSRLEVLLAYPDRIEWRPVCEKAVSDVERIQRLAAELMLLARLDNRKTRVGERIDLSTVVVDVTAVRNVTVDVGGPVVVLGHRAHLMRLLTNLLDNAERHATSQVTVSVTTTDSHAVVSVQDDGNGIPESDRDRVFDRFVRLDEARSRDDGGSGLGLAIARQIAVEHGGTLTVEPSETGALLVARFPLAPS